MKEKIMKIIRGILILLVLVLIGLLIYFVGKNIYTNKMKENVKDKEWVYDNTLITHNNSYGEDIFSISKHKMIDVYNMNYQDAVDKRINEIVDDSYTLAYPLVIYNPYGTNNLGVNVYFETEEEMEISYVISVGDEKIPNYSNTLNNDVSGNYTKEHAYQIIGLVPGYKNVIDLVGKTKDGKEVISTIFFDATKIKVNSDVLVKTVEGRSTEDMEDGLFVLFGLDKAFNANNYIYDNNGVLRADLVIEDYRSDRIEFIDGKLYYSYNNDGIGVINRLGRIEKEYLLDGYEMHHDYVYDKENNKFLILVNSDKEKNKTIEDLIISLDLETGEIKEVVDMKDLMPDIYKEAKMPESGVNTYGGSGLDWIHLNSLSIVDNGEIVVSGRELSSIISIKNIYSDPEIKYIITDEDVFEDTKYEDLVLDQKGEFVPQAGQHTITYVSDSSLGKGKYYLELYNNNYASSVTRESFPWDNYQGVGDFTDGYASQYYKYLVDENKGTYKLVKEFDVAYSSIVSSIQDVGDNHVTSSGRSNCYAEYDNNGVLIKQFNYTSQKYAYRVFKYNFDKIWFD